MSKNMENKQTTEKQPETQSEVQSPTGKPSEEIKIQRQPMPKFNKNFFIFLAFIFGITVLIAGVSVVIDILLYEGYR